MITETNTKNWYIVHTYSGFEERVRQNLRQRIEAMGMQEKFGDIRIPTETLVEMKGGKRREIQRKFFPGYIIIEMEMSDEGWHLVKNTPKVTGFVGSGKEPTPLTADEVEQILHRVTSTKEKPQAQAHLREGRARPDHRRPLHELHRGRRGHQPRPLHPEGDGHDFRALDAGRARVPAGSEALGRKP